MKVQSEKEAVPFTGMRQKHDEVVDADAVQRGGVGSMYGSGVFVFMFCYSVVSCFGCVLAFVVVPLPGNYSIKKKCK